LDLQLKSKKGFAAAAGKLALRTMAFGAAAFGAIAAGSIAVRRIALQNFRLKKIDIEELNVANLHVKNIDVTDRLSLPGNSNKTRKAVPKRISKRKKEEGEKSS
jgi:hypothetical protein